MKGDVFGSFTYFTSLVSQKLQCQSLHNVNSDALCVTELRYKPGLPILILSIQLHFAFYLRAADKRHFCCSLKEHFFFISIIMLFFFFFCQVKSGEREEHLDVLFGFIVLQ